jgi:hypothetical protein
MQRDCRRHQPVAAMETKGMGECGSSGAARRMMNEAASGMSGMR